ncbi:MAG: enoyl-CoA hydratase-related protein, partial [Petrimonas sp.]|nr:enoyl-CoA hydratase-related protein [Petrimonas sp.]
MEKIIIQKENHVATVTINEPDKLNALNTQILNELNSAFDILAADTDVRVIIITGADRSFVAGANIQEMAGMNYEEAKAFGEFGSSVFRKIETCPQPVIAAVNGFALGGGSELALACDIRIASEKAKFGQPEVGLGITPGFSGTQRLARLIGFAKAKELIFTGKVITAADALEIGLVNQVVAPESLMDEVKAMAESIAKQAPIAVQKSKEAINNGWDLPIEEGIDLEVDLFARCFETEDQKNGMTAFLKKE